MTTTTYGYRKPDDGDKAKGTNGWYASLNFNIDRFDAHSHNGIDSATIPLSSFTPFSQSITAVGWVTDSAGGYMQTITVPIGVTEVSDYNVKFIYTAPVAKSGEVAYLGYDRQSATTYILYCNDNTATFTAIYR